MKTSGITFFRFVGWILLFYASISLLQVIMGLVYFKIVDNYLGVILPLLALVVSLIVLFFVKKNPSDVDNAFPKRSLLLGILLTLLVAVIVGLGLMYMYSG
jgi:hypothetical protein